MSKDKSKDALVDSLNILFGFEYNVATVVETDRNTKEKYFFDSFKETKKGKVMK